jgi:hypothetical protein
MIKSFSLAALAFISLPLQAQQRPVTTTVLTDTSLLPPIDPARALEAEVRVALNDLLANRTVSALQRLQWLASLPATPAPAGSTAETLRGRGDMLFLLAEAQYRLGMDSAFRTNAQAVLSSGPARYAPLLQSQLLLSAYRTGDFARVADLVKGPAAEQARGLAALVAGLAAYQLRNYPTAATKFAAAKSAGGPYASYAEYMDVLTSLRADTTQTAAALARLEADGQWKLRRSSASDGGGAGVPDQRVRSRDHIRQRGVAEWWPRAAGIAHEGMGAIQEQGHRRGWAELRRVCRSISAPAAAR